MSRKWEVLNALLRKTDRTLFIIIIIVVVVFFVMIVTKKID